MQEIANIVRFLTKQDVHHFMQNEILSYYNQDTYIDILEIKTNNNRKILIKKFKHIPNRENHYAILKYIFNHIKDMLKDNNIMYVYDDSIKIVDGNRAFSTTFRYKDLEYHLKNGLIDYTIIPPLYRAASYAGIYITFHTEKIDEI